MPSTRASASTLGAVLVPQQQTCLEQQELQLPAQARCAEGSQAKYLTFNLHKLDPEAVKQQENLRGGLQEMHFMATTSFQHLVL